MAWLFYKVIVWQIIKSPYNNLTRPSKDAFRLFGLISRAFPITTKKTHICNNMKNVVSFYDKFLRTHHACGACYHFGTGFPSVSKMQRSTRRVNSIRDLFKTFTSWDGLVKLWEGACIGRLHARDQTSSKCAFEKSG